MNGEKIFKKLRLFLASPGDVAAERARLHSVVDELNRTGNLADEYGLALEVLDWQTHVAPLLGRPEDVVMQQLPVDAWDIFVGVMWLRFGTSTQARDPQTGQPFNSGTEEEFALAYNKWKKEGHPKILFYCCTRTVVNPHDIDLEQFARVKNFLKRFEEKGATPGLYQSFQTTEEFERRVRQDLTRLILQYGKEVLHHAPPQPVAELAAQGGDLEQRYLDFMRREHGRLKLFGFLSQANIDVGTLEVFVSLRFAEYGRELDRKRLPEMAEREDRALTPPEVLGRAIQKKKSLLLLGGPGSGKTTLLKYFSICCLEPRAGLPLQPPRIPILVPLRQISDPAQPFVEALAAWAKANNQNLPPALLEHWLLRRGALVLLDGLDEVSDLKTRRQVCEWIDKAAPAFPASTFVVTCRFTGYREAEGVTLQTPLVRADVLDFNVEQQRLFLQQWFRAAQRESLDEREGRDAVRLLELDHEAAAQTEAVMEFLGREESRALREMASVPVLLQIMAIIWKEQGSLSGERVELYNRCMDFLLDHRDKAKKIEPLLSAGKARLVLRPLALWMHADLQKDEAPVETVEKQLAEKLQAVRPGTTPREFLENLRDRAGVFVGAGADTYTFQHKSFREFLAALEIANRGAADILVENFGNDWWREILLFSAGLTSPEIFPTFLEIFLRHEKNAGAVSPLLLQLVAEAAAKPLAPFEKTIRNQKLVWQKRYNALKCVKLLRSEAAVALVQAARQDKEPKVRQLAEQILIEWLVIKPSTVVIEMALPRFFNPIEQNAEYILISAGTYKYSVTGKIVQASDLYFAKYPVTNKLYNFFLKALPKNKRAEHRSRLADDKRFNGDDQPVVGVNWHDAMAYCEWLTEQQKAKSKGQKANGVFRLPKEDEWEWAATGGKREYPWGNEKPDDTRANYGNKVGRPTPVGSYPSGATPEGLMDMAGNVWEWMENWYDKDQDVRVLRGGAYYSDADGLRGSGRFNGYPDYGSPDLGFRVCAGES